MSTGWEKDISNDNIHLKLVPTWCPPKQKIFTFTQRFYQQIRPQSLFSLINRPPAHCVWLDWSPPSRGMETPTGGAVLAASHPSPCAGAAPPPPITLREYWPLVVQVRINTSVRAPGSFKGEIKGVLGQPGAPARRVLGDVRAVGTVLQKPHRRQGIPQEMMPTLRVPEGWGWMQPTEPSSLHTGNKEAPWKR